METYLRIYGMTDNPLKLKIANSLEARKEIGLDFGSLEAEVTLIIDRIGILTVFDVQCVNNSLIYDCKMIGAIGDEHSFDEQNEDECQDCGYDYDHCECRGDIDHLSYSYNKKYYRMYD